MLRTLLLAPPGAGKGTQGDRLAGIYGVPHIATGDLLRAQVARRTPLGIEIEGCIERGELVPDRLVLSLVLEGIAGLEPPIGFVLDGFPRTLNQAHLAYEWGVANGTTFHSVIYLDVPVDELVRRVLERGRISSRADDTAETIRHRLAVYAESTAPLLDYYRGRGILLAVDGTGAIEEVTERIRRSLDQLDLS